MEYIPTPPSSRDDQSWLAVLNKSHFRCISIHNSGQEQQNGIEWSFGFAQDVHLSSKWKPNPNFSSPKKMFKKYIYKAKSKNDGITESNWTRVSRETPTLQGIITGSRMLVGAKVSESQTQLGKTSRISSTIVIHPGRATNRTLKWCPRSVAEGSWVTVRPCHRKARIFQALLSGPLLEFRFYVSHLCKGFQFPRDTHSKCLILSEPLKSVIMHQSTNQIRTLECVVITIFWNREIVTN